MQQAGGPSVSAQASPHLGRVPRPSERECLGRDGDILATERNAHCGKGKDDMIAIRRVQGRRVTVMSFAVLRCTVMCLVQFVYVWRLSAVQALERGVGGSQKFQSSFLQLKLGRLTCCTRPLSFTLIVYSTLPACVCPDNPIIPDKICNHLEYFQRRPAQSKLCNIFFFIAIAICASQRWQTSSICKGKNCTQAGFPSWSKWSVI